MAWFLFDLDGTLVDSAADIAAAVNHVRTGLSLPPLRLAEVLPHVGNGAGQLLQGLHPDLAEADLPALLAQWREYYLDHPVDATRPYPGIPELLAALPPGRAAVVTNKPEEVAWRVLAALGLDRHLPVLVGGRPGRPRKPDPAPFREALAALGGEAAGAAMVGDGPADMAGARGAGLVALGAGWGFHGARELLGWGAETVLRQPVEVLAWQERLAGRMA